jgi:hypothetical protein
MGENMSLWTTLVSAFSDRKGDGSRSQKADGATFERTAVRKRQRMKDGFIWADGMISPRPCTIRDSSVMGAQVVLWHDDIKPALLRGSLKLYSCADQQEVDCTVARRDGNSLGLRFTSTLHAPTRRYA